MENNELDFSWATTVNPEREKRILKEQLEEKERDAFIDKILDDFEKQNDTIKDIKPIDENKKEVVTTPKYTVHKRKKSKKKIIVSANITVVTVLAITLLSTHKAEASKIKLEKLTNELETTQQVDPNVNYNVRLVEESKEEEFNNLVNQSDKTINMDMPYAATRYLTLIDYDRIVKPFKGYISEYSEMYGVDPNFVTGLILVESPDYDINKDRDFHKVGLGQYKGEFFEGDVFKAHNFITNETDSYTFKAEELYQNPELQIKMLCMDLSKSASMYDYNLVAISENHNKGIGSLNDALEKIMIDYGYSSKESVLNDADPELITKNIQEIGDKNYSYKVLSCSKLCLDNHEYSNDDYIKFKNPKDGSTITISLNLSNERTK